MDTQIEFLTSWQKDDEEETGFAKFVNYIHQLVKVTETHSKQGGL